MKKQVLLTAVLSIFMLFGTVEQSNAQFRKFLKKVTSSNNSSNRGGNSSKKEKSGSSDGTFAHLNNEKDEHNLSGEYYGVKDKRAYGFKFIKEADGKVINKLHYWGKKQDHPQLNLHFKESYFRKKQIKLFFVWVGTNSESYVEVLELAPGVLVGLKTNRTFMGYDKSVPTDAQRTVRNVFVKNKEDFETWDTETAQAKTDMIFSSLNLEKIEKDKKKLMRFEAYKNYKGKIAFAKSPHLLKSPIDKQPTEKVAHFMTKGELGETVAYKPYLEKPLAISHPGAWFNITYEMAGKKTDREALRKSSTKFSKTIPRLNDWIRDLDFYFYRPRVLVNTSNNLADDAFLELLRITQNDLKQGQTYDLKVTVWAFKDGQNIDPVSTSTIQLEYTANTKKLLFDPVKGWITVLENYLDE